ncbi:histidinol-phosphate transaminase [Nocardioides massiliensis]|uniref:Aromatic amino acid aminotransferase n=1 Tax=Nocardioides massiliensis TaxID=1325935 RepID=A0ABT9NM00_9ACTN|nr:histidinol-phosphate transaminase [Nocardioides massiliensis]MDP9821452.1 histidinol-phosphate aminotransferase [Nocardioides massiliensis]
MTHLPTPRAAVTALPPYVPGRPPTPRPGLTTYKLSSNENPYPPLPGVVEAATRAVERMNRYPDMGCTELYAALADRLGVAPESLAAGTGSVAVLYHLLQAYCETGDEVVFAWRSFEAYPIAVAVTGASAVPVPLTADGRHDLDAMAAAITERTRVVVLCTPNNPTGPALTHAEVEAFCARAPEHVLVVVDEAYREFVRSPDPVDGVALHRAHPRVVVLRTFAKAYGLAGFRVGYALAHADVAAAVRACALPFGVSSVAQAAAIASLDAEDALLERVEALVAERARVYAGLVAQGWDVPDAQGNFVWLGLGDRALDFSAAADEAGLVVRPFAGDGVRVSIGEPEANTRFLELAARW